MANTAQKKKVSTISEEDFQSLTELRNMLDENTEQAIEGGKPYIAGILTELLAHVDTEVGRVNRYSRRISVAEKRSRVRELRKATNPQANANP